MSPTITTDSLVRNLPVNHASIDHLIMVMQENRSFDHYFAFSALRNATSDAMFSVAPVSGYPRVRLSGEPANATASVTMLNYGEPNNSGGMEWWFAANDVRRTTPSPLGYGTTAAGDWTAFPWIVQENRSLDQGMTSGSASSTWFSGVGDDANPCSRTAPCKTFAGTISKTAGGGEIDALDPAGYGAVTITKSITSDGGGGQVASVLVSGTKTAVDAWTVFLYRDSQGGCPQFMASAEPRLKWKVLNSGGTHLVVTQLRQVPLPANRPSALPSLRHPTKPRWLRSIAFTNFPGG